MLKIARDKIAYSSISLLTKSSKQQDSKPVDTEEQKILTVKKQETKLSSAV